MLITHAESGKSRVGKARQAFTSALSGQFERPFGVTGPPTMFGLPVLRHMKDTGLTHEQMANVAVVPGARRKGLGRRLVAACADLARDGWGYDDVLLEVECDNRPAVALYERAGFQELWRAPRAALEVDPRRESGPPLKRRDNVDHVAMRLPV